MDFTELLDKLADSRSFGVTKSDTWWYFRAESSLPTQGWKIHISATPDNASDVLTAVWPILQKSRVSWKVVPSLAKLTKLLTPPARLEHVAKFITVYPEDDSKALCVAESLYHATQGFTGPVVASDRRYLDSRNVFYRYGSFVGRYMYNSDALRIPYMVDVQGNKVKETRLPGHYRPEWVTDPFPVGHLRGRITAGFADRGIKVLGLLQQSVKGGVYLVEKDGVRMVMKEGRFGTAPDRLRRDARDRIRNEHRVLEMIKDLQIAPNPVDRFSFEQNEYLLMELLEGQSLRKFVESRTVASPGDKNERTRLIDNIADIVGQCHSRGIFIGDLSPNNIFVTGNGCKLIDLEVARSSSDKFMPFVGRTPGYFPPWTPLDDDAEHYMYAYGAVVFFICTGIDPYVCAEQSRADIERSLYKMARIFLRSPAEFPTVQNALALMQVTSHDDLQTRTDQIRGMEDIGEDLLAIMESARWSASDYLFSDPGAETFHPVSFYGGATGIAYLLWEYWVLSGRAEFRGLAQRVIEWMLYNHPYRPEEDPPGLYYGYGALPLVMALIDYPEYKIKVRDLASRLVPSLERGDVTHGRSGFGIALMRLFELTGDQTYADAAVSLYKQIAAGQPLEYLGFAHGIAGLAYFELSLGYFLGATGAFESAVAHLETLAKNAVVVGRGISWPKKEADPGVPWSHWCHGAAGVGEVFLSAGTLSDDDRFLKIAQQAGAGVDSIYANRVCGQCHGLAGDGEFVLRLARVLGTSDAWGAVENIRQKIFILTDRHKGYATWPGEASDWMGPTFMNGLLGVYSFLLRLHSDKLPLPLLLSWKMV